MERTGKNNSIYENKLDLHTLFIYEKKKIMLSSKQILRSLSNHSLLELHNNIFNRQTFFFYEFLPKIFHFHPFQETSNPRLSPLT